MIRAFCDGGGCPPEDLYYSVKIKSHGKIVYWDKKIKLLGFSTNYSEYVALRETVIILLQMHYTEATIFSDSQLAVNQVNGVWAINNENLITQHKFIINALSGTNIIVKWVPREIIFKELLH